MTSREVERDVTTLLGLKVSRSNNDVTQRDENQDVAKLFFDSFSKRLAHVEEQLLFVSSEFEKVKVSTERGQISDLVLLERIQKAEAMIRDTLIALRSAVEDAVRVNQKPSQEIEVPPRVPDAVSVTRESTIASHVLSPTGELGSLTSITTPTELQVLTLLASEGPKSAPEIGRAVGRSREHTARLMKKLYQEGYIRRDQTRIPFRYSVVDRLKQATKKEEAKAEGKEPISVPQT